MGIYIKTQIPNFVSSSIAEGCYEARIRLSESRVLPSHSASLFSSFFSFTGIRADRTGGRLAATGASSTISALRVIHIVQIGNQIGACRLPIKLLAGTGA